MSMFEEQEEGIMAVTRQLLFVSFLHQLLCLLQRGRTGVYFVYIPFFYTLYWVQLLPQRVQNWVIISLKWLARPCRDVRKIRVMAVAFALTDFDKQSFPHFLVTPNCDC
jgi:hypothetical protein